MTVFYLTSSSRRQWALVNYRRFMTYRSNVGACIEKKMEDFVELGTLAPKLQFNLRIRIQCGTVAAIQYQRSEPVNFISPIELEDMPSEYKKHRWLVYTAAGNGRVGWPMSTAEAQASGVGVCMANIRPDLREYVGPARFLYDSLSEVLEIISKRFPAELGEMGFEHAKKSDVFSHRASLFKLWQKASSGSLVQDSLS